MAGQLPADDHAAVGVEHEGEEDQAFPAAQVGQIGDPQPFGCSALKSRWTRSGREQPAGRAWSCATVCRAAWHRRSRWRASVAAPGSAAPARRHAAAPSTCAGSRRRSSWPRAARGCARAACRLRLLGPRAGRGGAGSRRTPTRPASCRSARPRSGHGLIDVAAHFGRSGSSSLAKNTLADFRISFARRSSKFSCRNRLISSRSSLVGRSASSPGRLRPGAPACATSRNECPDRQRHARSDAALKRQPHAALEQLLGVLPRSRHDSGDSPLPGQHPGIEDPAKPGPAQRSTLPLVCGR